MYTYEIYRKDRRRKTGDRLVKKQDTENMNPAEIARAMEKHFPASKGYRVVIHETWVTRENFLSGKKYQERYDTPRSCSPACELYWTM